MSVRPCRDFLARWSRWLHLGPLLLPVKSRHECNAKLAFEVMAGAFHVKQFRLPTMEGSHLVTRGWHHQSSQGGRIFFWPLSSGAAGQSSVKLHKTLLPNDFRFHGYEDFVFRGGAIHEHEHEQVSG